MKGLLFFLLAFGLPHAMWIPRKLGIEPDTIPIGVLNILFIIAFCLYILGRSSGPVRSNPFKSYNFFMVIVIIGVGIAFITDFGEKPIDILRFCKNQLFLLLLYFVPLVCTKNERDFTLFFGILLFVDLLIGLEVLRSGVLAGCHFNDMKRASGPFGQGWGWQGSDVAAGFLAQELMYFGALTFHKENNMILRGVAGCLGLIIFFALFATYARGAFFGALIGMFFIFYARGLKIKQLINFLLIIVLIFAIVMPASFKARISGVERGRLDESTLGRLYYYKTAFEILRDYPLGVGTGQMRSAMKKYTSGNSIDLNGGKYVDPHNSFLYAACEYGLIGLGTFVFFLTQMLKGARVIFVMRGGCPLVYRVYALGTFGFLGAFIMINMFYANFFKDLVMGTVVLHLGMLAFVNAEVIQRSSVFLENSDSRKTV